MKKGKQALVLHLCAFLLISLPARAQNLYTVIYDPVAAGYVFGQLNLSTCTFCPEATVIVSTLVLPNSLSDVIALPNGQVIAMGSNAPARLTFIDPPSGTPVGEFNFPAGFYISSGVLAPNGNVYITGGYYDPVTGVQIGQIYEFNPLTQSYTVLGTAPPNQSLNDLFFWNGQWYGFMVDYSDPNNITHHLVTVQLGTNLVFTIVQTFPGTPCGSATAVIPSGSGAGIYTGYLDFACNGDQLLEYDLPANSTSLACDVSALGFLYGLSFVPPGFPAPPANCACQTNAGTVVQTPINLCAPDPLTVPYNGDASLDGNDGLQYVLLSNPNDPKNSILLSSQTSNIAFNASVLSLGVTYYAGTVAGNTLAGNVDLNDPCLDFSNLIPVTWQAKPAVAFSVANNNLCTGDCAEVTLQFTGTAPFNLTYASAVSGTQTQTFSSNMATLLFCAPANGNPGATTLNALSLSDDTGCICTQ